MGNTTARPARAEATGTVVPFPQRRTRALTYRHQEPRPRPDASGQSWIEWCIEQQLSRLLDEHDVDTAVRLLRTMNPALTAESVEHLLDLADAASAAESSGPARQWHEAVDEYADALHALAVKVRSS